MERLMENDDSLHEIHECHVHGKEAYEPVSIHVPQICRVREVERHNVTRGCAHPSFFQGRGSRSALPTCTPDNNHTLALPSTALRAPLVFTSLTVAVGRERLGFPIAFGRR